jgi:hypothetical protein
VGFLVDKVAKRQAFLRIGCPLSIIVTAWSILIHLSSWGWKMDTTEVTVPTHMGSLRPKIKILEYMERKKYMTVSNVSAEYICKKEDLAIL